MFQIIEYGYYMLLLLRPHEPGFSYCFPELYIGIIILGIWLVQISFCLVWHLWSLVNKTCLLQLYSPPCMLFILRCAVPSAKELFLYRNWLFYTRVVLCALRLEKERVVFPLHLGDRRTKQPGELVTKPSIFFIMQLWTEDSIGDIWSPRCSHIRFLWFHCSSDSSENVHLTKTWLFYLLTCMW